MKKQKHVQYLCNKLPHTMKKIRPRNYYRKVI